MHFSKVSVRKNAPYGSQYEMKHVEIEISISVADVQAQMRRDAEDNKSIAHTAGDVWEKDAELRVLAEAHSKAEAAVNTMLGIDFTEEDVKRARALVKKADRLGR